MQVENNKIVLCSDLVCRCGVNDKLYHSVEVASVSLESAGQIMDATSLMEEKEKKKNKKRKRRKKKFEREGSLSIKPKFSKKNTPIECLPCKFNFFLKHM